MTEPDDNESKVTIPLDEAQASYLQSLGLRTLLNKGFGPDSPRYWHFAVAAVGLIMLGAACSSVLNRRELTEIVIPPAKIPSKTQKLAHSFAQKDKPTGAGGSSLGYRMAESGLGSYKRILPVAWGGTSETQLVDMIFEVSHLEGKKGLNRSLKSDGATLAHLFVQKNVSVGVFQVFLDAGGRLDVQKTGDPKAVLGGGDTPLMKAIRIGNYVCAKNLISTFTPTQLGYHKTIRGRDVVALIKLRIRRLENQISKIDFSADGKIKKNMMSMKLHKLKNLLLSVSLQQQT